MIIKAPTLTPEEEKLIQEEMRFRNIGREEAEKRIRRRANKMATGRKATGRFVKSEWQEILKKKPNKGKRFVSKKGTSYGQAGKAKDGTDRIKPNTKDGDAYCARSNKIKGDWRKNPDSPNNLSRRRWKCHGNKSSA